MAHDPEKGAAAFLGGELDAEARAAFSEHLLGCDNCWQEVHAAQRGRALAESARVVAPSELRDRVRALVLADSTFSSASSNAAPAWLFRLVPHPRGGVSRRTRTLAVGLVGGAAALFFAILSARPTDLSPQDPPPLAAAVADFRAQELPGRQLPAAGTPDLSRLRLTPVGAGGGRYGGLAVDGYAYRDSAGRRLVLYLSQQPFPTAPGASRLEGPDGPWTAQRGDVVILCARAPHALLVVGQDARLVRSVAGELGVL